MDLNEAERAAYDAATASSRKLLETSGKALPALTPEELLRPGEPSVLCNFPGRVPLTLNAEDGFRRVVFPPGTHRVPARLATDYPNKRPGDLGTSSGMHFYLAAHGVEVVKE